MKPFLTQNAFAEPNRCVHRAQRTKALTLRRKLKYPTRISASYAHKATLEHSLSYKSLFRGWKGTKMGHRRRISMDPAATFLIKFNVDT
jgi:hypothetical protein